MTLEDLNLPETPEAPIAEEPTPVLTLEALEEPAPAEAAPAFTLDHFVDSLASEPAPESPAESEPEPVPQSVPAPAAEPVVHQQTRQPVYHSAPTQPVYHNTPSQPQYHNTPSLPQYHAQPAAQAAPAQKPPKTHKHRSHKPPMGLRVVMQFASFLLAVVFFALAICGALLADMRELTSEGGIKKIVNALLMPTQSAPVSVRPVPVEAAKLSTRTDEATLPGDITVDEDGNINIGGDVSVDLGEIPDDILTGGGSEGNVLNLVDWLYDQIDESTDKPLKYSRDEMREFVQESTVSDFLSEKLAGYTTDFINGTEDTEITVEEVMDLLEENEDLMESKLNMEMNREQWKQIEQTVDKIVTENNISTTIRDKVYTAVDNVLEDNSDLLDGMDREDIQEALQLLTSDKLFYTCLGAAAVVLLLLCLLNYYNIPGGLTWAAMPTIFAGAILALPILLLTSATDLVVSMVPAIGGVVGVLASFVDVFAPVHYGVLLIGGGLLVLSIVWRIIRSLVRKARVVA